MTQRGGMDALFSGSGSNVSPNNVVRGNIKAYTANDYSVESSSAQLSEGVSSPGSGGAARNEVTDNRAITTLNLANDDPDMIGIDLGGRLLG